MMRNRILVAALAATTMLAGSAAYAADDASATPPPGHAAAIKSFNKLSADASRGYHDLTMTRLAIFDGRTDEAKKLIDEAQSSFDKAKSDESVFTGAEAEMRMHMSKDNNGAASNNGAANNSSSANNNGSENQNAMANGKQANASDAKTPKEWLPVDAAMDVAEDYSAQPAKAAAMADANKSLAKGDRKGAMEKLKLAGVDLEVVTAVVPLKQTLSDVQAAAQLIDSGKYYEGSQKIRDVQNSTIYVATNYAVAPEGKAGSNATNDSKDKSSTTK